MTSDLQHQSNPSIPDEHDSDEEQFMYPDDGIVIDEGEEERDVPMDDADDDGHDPEQDEVIFEDNSIQQFLKHGQSVFSVSVHPTLPIAASGGEDEMGYLWNIQDGELIAPLSGHTDSISRIAFSFDGTLIASGGMDGKARVWRLIASNPSGKDWDFLTEVTGPDEILVRHQ